MRMVLVSLLLILTPAWAQQLSQLPNCSAYRLGKVVKKVTPEYPDALKKEHVEGVVVIRGVISKDGVPRDLRALHATDDRLIAPALDAVEQWRYEPFRCGDNPIDVETEIAVNFTLEH